jgi:hypothetical protein
VRHVAATAPLNGMVSQISEANSDYILDFFSSSSGFTPNKWLR